MGGGHEPWIREPCQDLGSLAFAIASLLLLPLDAVNDSGGRDVLNNFGAGRGRFLAPVALGSQTIIIS